MKVGEYIRSFHQFECPYCGSDNLIDNGDENDLSAIDVEEVDCESCKETFRLTKEE